MESLNTSVLFWGTPGIFAEAVLQGLLAANCPIVGVVIPGVEGTGWQALPPPAPIQGDAFLLPMLPSFVEDGLAQRAWEHNIPVFRFGGAAATRDPRAWQVAEVAVKTLQPTVIVVACWHQKLPPRLLAIPPWGGLNVHPSCLPDFRGPTPLFWQRRAGLTEGGVTIHAMSHAWDSGAIMARRSIPFPTGATMDELDSVIGTIGSEVLNNVLLTMAQRQAQPMPQRAGGSYQSFPHAPDFRVPVSWTALHAWNFMRVAEGFGTPFDIVIGEDVYVAQRAIAYQPSVRIPNPLQVRQDGVAVQFRDGVVVVV